MKKLALLALLPIALACSSRETPPAVVGTLDGVVYVTGPTSGAVVAAYALDPTSGAPGDLLGTSQPTDPTGAFHVEIGPYFGPVLLVAKGVGATYTEPSSTIAIHWDATTTLRGTFVAWTPGQDLTFEVERGAAVTGLVISPFSELAIQYAGSRVKIGRSTDYKTALDRSFLLFRDHLEVDFWSTLPADLTVAGATGWNDGVQLGAELSGFSALVGRMASESSISAGGLTSLELLALLDDDLSDAKAFLDGQGLSGPLTLGTCARVCNLSGKTLRADWSAGIADFLGSPANASGIKVTDADQLLGRISSRSHASNELFADDGSTNFDTVSPVVTVTGIASGDILSGAKTFTVTAFDAVKMGSAAEDFTLAFCRPVGTMGTCNDVTAQIATLTPAAPDAQTRTLGVSLDTTAIADGPVQLQIHAVDDAGNADDEKLSLFFANTGPGSVGGTVVLGGRVVGARVRVFEYDGAQKGKLLGQATTDGAGLYLVEVASTTQTSLLLQVDSDPSLPAAQYIEGTSGATVIFSPGDVLETVLTGWFDGARRSDGIISPWTHVGTSFARARWQNTYASNPSAWPTAVTDAFGALDAHFSEGVTSISIRNVQPADLTSTDGTSTLNAQVRYGLLNAALGQRADKIAADSGATAASINTLTLTKILAQDIGSTAGSDEPIFNGHAAGPLMEGMDLLDSYVTRVDLAISAVDFLELNPRNATAFKELDVATLLDHVAGDANPILYPASEPPIPYDVLPPSPVGFVLPTPADGAIVTGTVLLEAQASDNRALAGFTWTTTAVAASHLDTTAGLAGPWTLNGALDTTAIPEGMASVAALAVDEANNKASIMRSFVVDRTPPVVTITAATAGGRSIASGGFTGGSTITLTGTAVDLHLSSATLTWNGTPMSITVGADGAWSAMLPLSAGPNTVSVTAADAAGNAATPTTATYNRDATPPTVTVVATGLSDEASATVTISGTGAGTVAYDTSLGSFVTLGGSGTPNFTKFASRYTSAGPNLPEWRFNVTDNHTVPSAITFEVRLSRQSGATFFPLTTFQTVPVTAGGGFNRSQIISTALTPAVGQLSGTYELEYRATDEFGNVSAIGNVQWNQTVKAPPIRQQQGSPCDLFDGECPSHYGLSAAFVSGGTPMGANTAHIPITGSGVPGGKLQLAGGEIDNPNLIPVRVTISAVVPTTYSVGDIFAHPQIADPTGVDPVCDQGTLPSLVGGAGCFTPESTTETRVAGKPAGNLLTSIVVHDTSGTVLTPCPSCSANEWEIPANSSIAVTLLGNPFTFLATGFSGTVSALASVGSVSPLTNVTGVTAEQWLACVASHVFPDGVTRCTNQVENEAVHYFTALRVDPASSVSLQARPANDAATLSTPDGTGITSFSYQNYVWNTAEDKPGGGTFTKF